MADAGSPPVNPRKVDDPPDSKVTPMSFKEKLIGVRPSACAARSEFLLDDDIQAKIKVVYVDNNPLKPRVDFDDDLEEELARSWRHVLVVKVYGRSVGYYYLSNKLATLWKLMGEWEMLDVGNGFFVVRFQEEDDILDAFVGGPYNIGSAHLSIQKWTPDVYAGHQIGSCPTRAPPAPEPPLVGVDDERTKDVHSEKHTTPFGEWMNPRRTGFQKSTNQEKGKHGNRQREVRIPWKQKEKTMATRHPEPKDGFPVSTNNFNVLFEDFQGVYEEVEALESGELANTWGSARVPLEVEAIPSTVSTMPSAGFVTHMAHVAPAPMANRSSDTDIEISVSLDSPMTQNSITLADTHIPSVSKPPPPPPPPPGERPEGATDMGRGEGEHSPGKPPPKRRSVANNKSGTENRKGAGVSNSTKSSASHYMVRHKPNVVVLFEPKISGTSAERVCYKLGFRDVTRVEAVGFLGGIWVLWNGNQVDLTRIAASDQFVHFRCRSNAMGEFTFTAIYAKPSVEVRNQLWEDLKRLATSINYQWLLSGDFNAMMSAADKKGGADFSYAQHRPFIECCQVCGFSDFTFLGSRFTWARRAV
ncbi:hypothetical protein LINGRAHAP2_LOCUS30580 [Linum grandiflorum]